MWGAVGDGLVAHVPPRSALTWANDDRLRHDVVLDVLPDPDGTRWVGTLASGLVRCRGAACTPIDGGGVSGRAEGLARGRDGTLYVAGYTDGLFCLPRGAARLVPCSGPTNPRSLALGPDGRLWSTTADAGLFVRTLTGAGDRWRAFPSARQGSAERLGALTKPVLPLDGGRAWVGTLGQGLYLATDAPDGPRVRRLPLAPDIGDALRVVALARRGDTLYAATLDRGVARIVGAEGPRPVVRWIDAARGLPSTVAYGLTVDRRGRVWAVTDRGAAQLLPDGTARGLTAADGWPGAASMWNATRAAPDGRVLIGTEAGLLVFDPDAMPAPLPPPAVYLTDVRVRGERRLADATAAPRLRLDADENVLSVDLAAGNAGPVRPWTYAYRLVRNGTPGAWQSLGTRATLDLAGVAPGRYRLDVRTELAGRASPVRAMAFDVAPPWWQTLWFRALAALAVVALLTAAYRARVAHLLALERTRRRIADDLHDDLGSKIASLATRLDVADFLAAQAGTAPGSAARESHAASARALVGDLSDAVWLIDAHADRLDHLADKVERVARSVLPHGAYRVRIGALPPLPMAPEVRRNVLLAVREMLHNAARHGTAPFVLAVDCLDAGATPTLRIDLAHPRRHPDAPPVPTGGRGLGTLQRRAAALGGTFSLDLDDDGARARLTVPIRRPAPWRRAWDRLALRRAGRA